MLSRIFRYLLWFTLAIGVLSSLSATAASNVSPRKRVAILLFNGVQVIDYSGPYEVFADAGYDVFTVASSSAPIETAAGNGMTVTARYTFENAPQADVLIIPGGDYEAPINSATIEWIRGEAAKAQHVMSVCNGALTLANTGLLKGLSATTTAQNIYRLKSSHPEINVVNNRRVVDNGKFITTAGLSAGIDGALHLLDVLDGKGAGKTIALQIEYNWQPQSSYVRGLMADRVLPPINYAGLGMGDVHQNGDDRHWVVSAKISGGAGTPQRLKEILQRAYATDRGFWQPGSLHMTTVGPSNAHLAFTDREGAHWGGSIETHPSNNDPVTITLSIERTSP